MEWPNGCMSNVVAYFCHCCYILWQMVLPLCHELTDVIVNVADGKPLNDVMADVIALVADRLTSMLDG